ncbi:MAG: hypothetical protein JJU00_13925, partial [Opitutales bacterium]|nr:hypothetical protein [Opitutales bacterium]
AALGGGDTELRGALAACFPGEGDEASALARYRLLMLGKGAASKRDGTGSRIDPAALAEAASSGGELEAHELLRLRARFFTHGKALGTEFWLSEGAGAAALSRLRKPPGARPVDVLKNAGLAVAGGGFAVEPPVGGDPCS